MILPIQIPELRCYQNYAYPLAIIMHQPAFLPWFHGQFVQLYCRKQFNQPSWYGRPELRLNFYKYDGPSFFPQLQVISLNQTFLDQQGISLNRLLSKSIAEGFYVVAHVNEYYIPNRRAYQDYHRPHDFFIYGFDDTSQEFHTLGYNHHGLFETLPVPMKLVDEGITSYVRFGRPASIYLIKPNVIDAFPFQLSVLVSQLMDYLQGTNVSRNFAQLHPVLDAAYGIEVYPYIEAFLDCVMQNEMRVDHRNFRLLWEHKYALLLKVAYLSISVPESH
ncbi:hypothetical protein IDH44_19930 [Paenibacillus sp. IB182496]|uniref:Uncharacterized protein n=1 Tax=Paenibacillus sabuli TaxID=2772509 RepID=A0A927BXE1_9BACL|nr:hypothetical protein [Paenibacillus sabuli]MBD2847475.1 hypothetical protein [Paenibacillus sabuli]